MSRPRLIALGAATLLPAAAAAQAPASDTAFTRDPALMRAKQAQLVAAIKAKDPGTAAQLEQAFGQDIVAAVRPAFRPYGFSTEDAADMTAAYWITAWEASHGKVGVTTPPPVAAGVRRQLAGALGPQLRGHSDAQKQDVADTMLLQMLLADARMRAAQAQGAAAVQQMSDAVYREASALLKADLRAVEMTADGFRPSGRAAASSPPAAGGKAPSPASGRTPPVAGLYFRSVAAVGGGVGFEPLVFFASGEYVELDETPLPELDAAADKATSPRRWGRWRREGDTFLLTNDRGRTSDYRLGTGSFFPAFPSEKGPKLAGTYKRTTGSTIYMADGPVSTMGVTAITFNADGTFTQGSSGGGVAPGASAYSRRGAAGRWTLANSTLELVYSDGRRERKSFVWGAQGTPPRPDPDMAFIGGDVFLLQD